MTTTIWNKQSERWFDVTRRANVNYRIYKSVHLPHSSPSATAGMVDVCCSRNAFDFYCCACVCVLRSIHISTCGRPFGRMVVRFRQPHTKTVTKIRRERQHIVSACRPNEIYCSTWSSRLGSRFCKVKTKYFSEFDRICGLFCEITWFCLRNRSKFIRQLS